MTLTIRTLKIAFATVLAIWVASLFQLDNTLSAGIIAILTVLDTRKASLETAASLFLSTLLALASASIMFFLFGYSTLTFGLYLLVYVPLSHKLKLQGGVVTCSVLVTHLLVAESTSLSLLSNEVILMVVGAGIAILFNWYMPSQFKKEINLKLEIEDDMKQILKQFNIMLRKEEPADIGALLTKLEADIKEAMQLALYEYDNQIFKKSDYYIRYFQMRKEQLSVLIQMRQHLDQIELLTRQNNILGALFYLTAEQLNELNPAKELLEDVDLLHEEFREASLPQTREEFESRAVLFQLMLDFKKFLQLKRSFYLRTHK